MNERFRALVHATVFAVLLGWVLHVGRDILVPVVQQMNPRKMSEVLAAMAPERAEKLTVALATMPRGPGAERVTIDPASLPGTELPAIAPAPRR